VYGGARPRPRAYNTATEFRDASKGTRAPSHGARGDPLWQSSFGYVAFLLRRDRLRKARQKSWNMQGVARNHFRRARARRCMRPRRWTKHSGHLYIACGEGGFPGGRRSHFPAGFSRCAVGKATALSQMSFGLLTARPSCRSRRRQCRRVFTESWRAAERAGQFRHSGLPDPDRA
jgi:hypothetical protein